MNEYFITYCFYLGLIVSLLIGFGFGFYFLVKSGWNNLSSKFGTYAFVPRFIGTPVHELGHLIFAVLTGSKIKRVKLFPKINARLRKSGGGYVEFSPRKGILGSISCFFSGIGPMLFCPFVIMVLMYFLMPELYAGMRNVFTQTKTLEQGNFMGVMGTVIQEFFGSFQFKMLEEWNFYLFLILAIPIANECILSAADVKNAGKGFILFAIVLLVLGYAISYFPSIAVAVNTGLAKGSSFFMCTLCLGLVFNLIHWGLGAIVHFLL